jgi:hypothetical protein
MRSCSPTTLPSPRQADNFFFFFLAGSAAGLHASTAMGLDARTARQKRHLPQIDLGAQDLNDIQRPKSFQKNSWK